MNARILLIYLAVINLLGLYAFWSDKQKARKGAWRTSEKALFLLALLGGSIGCNVGMYLFHHKTKHMSFVIGMPLILILQAALFLRFGSVIL